MTNPKLILADEPTKELSGEQEKDVLNQLFHFAKKKGSTIIVISNEPEMVEIADRSFRLENCKLCEQNKAG